MSDDKGATVRQHLLHVYKKTGKKPDLLLNEPKKTARELRFLNIFWKLELCKETSDKFITPKEILSWCKLFKHKFSLLEIDLIMDLDHFVVKTMNENNKKNK